MVKNNQIRVLRYVCEREDISTLEELQIAMKKNGVVLTREKLHNLCEQENIVKQPNESGKMVYRPVPEGKRNFKEYIYTANLTDLILRTSTSGIMVAVHTKPAWASTVAAILDNLQDKDILATVAGYDTVMIMTPNPEAARRVAEKTGSLVC